MGFEDNLKIHLIEPIPYWANAGISVLAGMSGVTVGSYKDQSNPDIVLYYGDRVEESCQQYGYGRLGFWFFRFAGTDLDVITAARLSAAAGVALEVSLWATFSDGRRQCLYQSFGFHEPFVIRRGVSDALAKAAFFPSRVIVHYFRTTALPNRMAESVPVCSNLIVAYVAELRAIANKIVRKAFYNEQWCVVVGIGRDAYPDSAQKQWFLESGPDRFWADPFPLEYEGRRWVLVEEFLYSSMRAHLAAIELLDDGHYCAPVPLMSSASHLSYPFVFTWKDALYMLPESSAARQVTLWKCEVFPDKWQQVAILLEHVYASDATLFEYQGCWWMFVSMAQKGACIHDELYLYFADTPLGPWQAHPENPVKSDARSARPAGNLFIENGVLYRPAQDCGTLYGEAIVLNRVDRLDKEGFSESPVAVLGAGWCEDFLQMHTLARSESLWAVDVLRLIPKWRGFLQN